MSGRASKRSRANSRGDGRAAAFAPSQRAPRATSGSGRVYSAAQKRKFGRMMGARRAAEFPYKTYGSVMRRRGTATSLAKYGASWRAANTSQRADRTNDGWSGAGRYTGNGRYTGRGGFWNTMGNMAGAALSEANPLLGAGFNAVRTLATGKGNYTASNNIVHNADAQGSGDGIMRFSSPTETGDLEICHTEFVSNIYAGGDSSFQQTLFDINPGIESTFNWGSSIAANFKEYELMQCAFSYKSSISDFQTSSGTVGTVLAAVQYNPQEEPFDSQQAMMASVSAVSAKSTKNIFVGVECDPKLLPGGAGSKFVRVGGLKPTDQIQEYDQGRFSLATHNFPPALYNQCIGELWVSYRVRLRRPTIAAAEGQTITRSSYGVADLSIYDPNNPLPSLKVQPGPGQAVICNPTNFVANTGGGGSIWSTLGLAQIEASENHLPIELSTLSKGLPARGPSVPASPGTPPSVPATPYIPVYAFGLELAQDPLLVPLSQQKVNSVFPILSSMGPSGNIASPTDFQTGIAGKVNCYPEGNGPGSEPYSVLPTGPSSTLTVTFPAQYTGNIEMKFTLVAQTEVDAIGFMGYFEAYLNATANVRPIRDMLNPEGKGTSDADINTHVAAIGGFIGNDRVAGRAGGCRQFAITMHFRVEAITSSASGSVAPADNQIHLVGAFFNPDSPGVTIPGGNIPEPSLEVSLKNAEITFTEYNHFSTNNEDPRPVWEYSQSGTPWVRN